MHIIYIYYYIHLNPAGQSHQTRLPGPAAKPRHRFQARPSVFTNHAPVSNLTPGGNMNKR